MKTWGKITLFTFIVLLPALAIGISNCFVFPDALWLATILLIVTVGVSGVFTWMSADATQKITRYCLLADVVICAILVANVGGHWILSREISAAQQGVTERHAEEDREEVHKDADVARRLKLADAEAKAAEASEKLARAQASAANAERRRLATLPVEQRRNVFRPTEPKAEPVPSVSPLALLPMGSGPAIVAVAAAVTPIPKLTPDQVRAKWWWFLTALAIAECAASILAGAILIAIWEWDRNKDGIPDHLQMPQAVAPSDPVGKSSSYRM